MIPRHLRDRIVESLESFPVVLLIGPRQVGKSTLAQQLAGGKWRPRYLTLDDPTVLGAALARPDSFLEETEPPLILDEVQRAPELLRAVKRVVDRSRRPGMFLLTGSANVLTLSKVSETLAGRVAVHGLHPFSWGELHRRRPAGIIDGLFRAGDARAALRLFPAECPASRSAEWRRLVLTGGFPRPALMRSAAARRTWFDSYRQTYIERDLRDLASLEHLPEFTRLLTVLALRTGQELNVSSMARDLGLPATTLRRYLGFLEQTFRVFRVAPYFANVEKRLVKTPKLFLSDTGMACHLGGVDGWETIAAQDRAGPLAETWVACELRKALSLGRTLTSLWHWRAHGGEEVDFLLERGPQVIGIEVKLSAEIRERELKGLAGLRRALGDRLRLGIILHPGTEAVAFNARTIAVPFAAFFGRDGR
jgi:predicted AAA+ superfamily ATPase